MILRTIEKAEFTLGISEDMLKAFNTANRDIFLSKLHNCDIKGNYLPQLRKYLASKQKQYISFDQIKKTTLQSILCGVPQGSILGSLLFLIYAYDPCMFLSLLATIMFIDDTNLFLLDQNIEKLFSSI